MSKQLILTGWGRLDYAAAAAVVLRAIGEADVLGVSMRRLADVLEKESAGHKVVYVLGVGLGNEAEVRQLATFDKDINEEAIMAIAKRKPGIFVMCDGGFATDNVADNFEQIWREFSPETRRWVL